MPGKLKCGIIMPISVIDGCSETHWENVRDIIKEALSDTEFEVELVSDSNEVGIIQKRIVQNIYDNQMVICDVSAKNPNVMFELGMRLAFDKPTIIIKDNQTNYSFDTSPIEHLEYPRDLHYHSIQTFKKRLKEKTIATYEASKHEGYTTFLGHFGQFVVAKIDEKEVGKEDYVLQAISELRDEMKFMRRSVHKKEAAQTSLFNMFKASDHDKDVIDELKFLTIYVPSLQEEKQELLLSGDPEIFDHVLSVYLRNHVPDNIAMKNRHIDLIQSNMIEAIESYNKANKAN